MGYSDEVINFILDGMIPDRPLPRGGIKKKCDEVAIEVNEVFAPEELCGKPVEPKNILYVYQKYGTDPAYGARKGLVIHPVKSSADKGTPKVLPSNAKQVNCPHCGEKIYLDGSQQPTTMPTPTTAAPMSVPKAAPTATPATPATVPTSAPTSGQTAGLPTRMPNNYLDPRLFTPAQLAQAQTLAQAQAQAQVQAQAQAQRQAQRQAQPQSQYFPAAGMWSDPSAHGGVQNTAGQSDQSQGVFGGSSGNNTTLAPELLNQWLMNSTMGTGNQQMTPTNLFAGQNMAQQNYQRSGPEATPSNHQQSASPTGLGITPSQPSQAVATWPTSGSGQATEAPMASNMGNNMTPTSGASTHKRPFSRSQLANNGMAEGSPSINVANTAYRDTTTDAGPASKRSKTTAMDQTLLNNRGGCLIPDSGADDSLFSTPSAFDGIQFDWSYPSGANDNQPYVFEGAPAANPTAVNTPAINPPASNPPVADQFNGFEGLGNAPPDQGDDAFFAQFLADLDDLPNTT